MSLSFRVYPEAGAAWSAELVPVLSDSTASFTIPPSAEPGDRLHIIVKAQAGGRYRLVRYQQVIVTVE